MVKQQQMLLKSSPVASPAAAATFLPSSENEPAPSASTMLAIGLQAGGTMVQMETAESDVMAASSNVAASDAAGQQRGEFTLNRSCYIVRVRAVTV